jgi:hypothetical protein
LIFFLCSPAAAALQVNGRETIRGEPLILSGFRSIFKWRRGELSATQLAIRCMSRNALSCGARRIFRRRLDINPSTAAHSKIIRGAVLSVPFAAMKVPAREKEQILRLRRRMTGTACTAVG